MHQCKFCCQKEAILLSVQFQVSSDINAIFSLFCLHIQVPLTCYIGLILQSTAVAIALVRAGFGLFHLLLYFEELVLKYHDQDPYNNQLAAVQACIKIIKPGCDAYWEVTLFLNYIVRVWPLSLMLLNNLQWFSMTISNKVNATQWVCLKMEPLHTENHVARSISFTFFSDQRVYVTVLGNFYFLIYKKKKKKSALFQSYCCYCKSQYLWGYYEGTLRLLWQKA